MPLAFQAAALSDVGRVRTNNEDAALVSGRLLLLADGMGGAAGGEVASAVAVHVMGRVESAHPPVRDALEKAFATSRRLLHEITHDAPALAGMGTTLLALGADHTGATLLHIGDSRAFLCRGGQLRRLTTDHTFVQSLVDDGLITSQEAAHHPYRAMVTKVLDDSQTTPPDLIDLDLRAGDRVLLCSDGVTDVLPEERIRQLCAEEDRDKVADALVRQALDDGSRDNVTAVVADVVDSAETADPSDPVVVGAAADSIALPWASADDVPDALRWAAGLDVDPGVPGARGRRRWRWGRRS